MAETVTPTTAPAQNSAWTNSLNSLLTTGTNIFTGVLSTQAANANNKANAKLLAAQAATNAQAQSQSGATMKYILIGGGVLVAVLAVVFLMKRK